MAIRERQRSRIGAAIHRVRTEAGLKQADLVAATGMKQNTLSDWEATPVEVERVLNGICQIEEACKVPRGQILRIAGYVEDSPGVLAEVDRDDKLNPESRRLLRALYQAAVSRSE